MLGNLLESLIRRCKDRVIRLDTIEEQDEIGEFIDQSS